MRKIRILYSIPNFITAGSGRVMANIFERLDKTRFEVLVCVQTAGGRIYDELIEKGYKVMVEPFTISAQPYHSLITRASQASRHFKELDIDLWHSFHYADDYTEPLIAHFSGAKDGFTRKKQWGGVREPGKFGAYLQVISWQTTMRCPVSSSIHRSYARKFQ